MSDTDGSYALTIDEYNYPQDVDKVVPVLCSSCRRRDMTFTVRWFNQDSREWMLHCEGCGDWADGQKQVRHRLWVNNNTVYVGSYWGPDD